MKNGKRVRRDESPSDISSRGLAGQAPISSFSCPSFSWPLLSSLFSVYTKGVLKVAKRQKIVHFSIYIKTRRCETHIETVLECAHITQFVELLVFGAGAIGSFFGALLSQRHDVTLIGRAEHVSAIKSRGLRVRGKTAIIAKPRAAIRVSRTARPDFVFVTTKSYDTANAMLALRPFADRAIFVTLQNGLGNAETIAKTARRVVAGTTAHGVTFEGPGEVRHAGVGETVLGAWARVDEADLVRLRDVFADVGIAARVTSDIRSELWSKLVVNASINPVAALAGVPNGRLVRDRRLQEVLGDVCREAVAVAKAEGARVDSDELYERTVLIAKRTASNRASMLQDLERHRRTEIEAITGVIVRAADRHRIPVPHNRMLYALVRAREFAFRATSDTNEADGSVTLGLVP